MLNECGNISVYHKEETAPNEPEHKHTITTYTGILCITTSNEAMDGQCGFDAQCIQMVTVHSVHSLQNHRA